MAADTFLGRPISPLTRRRIDNFRANRRGYGALWIFGVLFALSLVAELWANDKPLVVRHAGNWYVPIFATYPETTFGGIFKTEADYRSAEVQRLIEDEGDGWIVWPPVRYSYDTYKKDLPPGVGAPSPPTAFDNWLGTDDQARDVLARAIYGFRMSVLFALVLTALSAVVGVAAGAVQGYFGGWVDLVMQRFIEVWTSIPLLFTLIILASIVEPNVWWLLGIMLLFEWVAFVYIVRAEFLKVRNLDYVRAARALGVLDRHIMFRHILPNAMVSTLTYLPFVLTGAVTLLTSLDFLGFGLPPGSPSLGEMVGQGKENPQAPWLGLTAFTVLSVMLVLLVFVGEAVRDAFDPYKAVDA
ncbi:ABC transporter permease [bacterium]|nr:ABC transporter permease [Chloroflexi bacterium CFX6]RIL09732.1 MAG: ABC transporter permease [bacterium]